MNTNGDDYKCRAFGCRRKAVEMQAEIDRLRDVSARYEKIRKLSPRQFSTLWHKNLLGEKPFDRLVDDGDWND